jgi:uncharacterized protein
MRFRNLVIAAGLCIAGPALAQTPATPLPQAPSAHHAAATRPRPAQAEAPATATAATKVDPAKEAAIRHLMDITQTNKLGDSMASYISGQVRTFMSHSIDAATLPKFMDTFNQKFATTAPPQNITDAMVPIYDQAFSMDEIQGLVTFYESPLGQHVVKVLPQVLEDSQNAAAKIDQEAALDVLRGMSNDYPELKRILPDTNQPAEGSHGAPAAPQPAPATPQN